jgi:2-keto-4-pentenoate hydratase/2-oxohepta-3-ene-1,7-dioic acid hydratase in catechol pathway
MRLLRYGEIGAEKPGLLDQDGNIRDLSAHVSDFDGASLGKAQIAMLRALQHSSLPIVRTGARIGACVAKVPNLIAIGLNYRDHAAESNQPIPGQPIVFNKHTGSICGPNDPVICPPGSGKLDWEVELGVVIGTHCWHIEESGALDCVAGFCLANDVSERAYQLELEGQWTKGKSYPTFAPLGPWLVTLDEIPDPQNLDLALEVNGVRRQSGNTRNMIYGVKHIVAYLSRFMALEPGDVIVTGTPSGVGLGFKPPVFLKVGDTVTLSGAGLGTQRQQVVAYKARG